MSSTPALSAVGVTKRYGVREALNGITLDVPAGSITALVGPNGAGKSTLLRAFAALDRPTAGHLAVLGVNPWRDRGAALSNLAFVPQQAAIYANLTVAEHLTLAAYLRPRFDRTLASERLRELDIPERAEGGRLSGGQAAQVALALALGTRARVLLLDEPLAALDPLARREFLAVLRRDAAELGTTVLFSSHVVSDIEQVCDRLVVVGLGHVLLDSSVSVAVASHRVVPAISAGESIVAALTGADHRGPVAVVRVTAADAPGQPPTVEELVLAYLALGRIGRLA